MISSLANIEPGDLFTTDGKDAWGVFYMYDRPSITLVNLRTGDIVGGGIGCPLLKDFVPLAPAEPITKKPPQEFVDTSAPGH